MPTRPRLLTAMAVVFTLIGLSFPIQLHFAHGHGLSEMGLVLAKLTWLNYLIIFGAFANTVLLWRASPWLKLSVPLMAVLVVWNNIVVGSYGYDFRASTTLLASVGFLGLCAPLLKPEIRRLLSNPNLRWWLRPKRVQIELETTMHPYVGEGFQAKTFDLSTHGAFVSYDQLSEILQHRKTPLAVGDMTSLSFKISQTHNLRCQAKVVRVADAKGEYPAGFGLEFIKMNPAERLSLRNYIAAR